jgi:hypothetical protein
MSFTDSSTVSLLRLRVVADADPGAIARVIERFQNLNCVPRRLVAEFDTDDKIHIQVDVCGIPEAQLALIAQKVGHATSIIGAYWHRL